MSSDSPPVIYTLIALAAAVYLVNWLRPGKQNFPDIPAVGPSAPILSYYGAFKFLYDGQKMMQEGYDKYKGSAFKIPQLFRWHVLVTGRKLVDELRKAGDDELSFHDATTESLQTDYTLGPDIAHNSYHIPIIRSQLTRNLAVLFDHVRDELCAAFEDVIPPTDEWTKVVALPTLMKVVCRTSNRIFVGLPTCRDPDYGELNIKFTIDVVKSAMILNMFPRFLRPLAAYYLTDVPTSIARGVKHLESVIKERYQQLEEYGSDWEGKPNDMLMWLMEEASGKERDIRALVLRILTVNFAAIHTSSMSFAHALFHLAANPEYLGPLREEVESIVKQEGWTKAAMQKMRKVDSFMRECQRYHGIGIVSMTRRAVKDFRFSDGTLIPKGGFVSVASMPTHHDDEFYADPDFFNPWRFADLREEEGEGLKHQMVSTSVDYMPFGHGRHACPGRFFAANELKAMLAQLVITYDIKMEKEGIIPEPIRFGFNYVPNPKAEVLFRKRRQ